MIEKDIYMVKNSFGRPQFVTESDLTTVRVKVTHKGVMAQPSDATECVWCGSDLTNVLNYIAGGDSNCCANMICKAYYPLN